MIFCLIAIADSFISQSRGACVFGQVTLTGGMDDEIPGDEMEFGASVMRKG